DGTRATVAVEQSILAAAVLSLLLAVPVVVWTPALVGLFRVEPDVAALATRFVRLLMLAVPPDAIVFVVACCLRAAGDMRTPLLIGAVTGAALGAVTAFSTGAVLGLWLLAGGSLRLHVRWRGARPDVGTIRRILRVGYPAAA